MLLELLQRATGVDDPVALLVDYADAHPDDMQARQAAIEAILIEISEGSPAG